MTLTAEPIKSLDTSLERVIEIFDAELRSDLPFVNSLTERVRRYRGKLLRPRLLLLAGQATGELRREHIVLAAVVEMVHMATLVHDDVLDEADVRRRDVSINRLIGNEGAVMLGDYLISHAYHLCSSLQSTDASRAVAAATNTVCEGELMQIHERGNYQLSESTYLEIIRRKTAALTGVCCELGATFSNADAEVVEQLRSYGLDLGIAFQIVDDLLDLTATESDIGKSSGRDADLAKMTLPMIRFMYQATSSQQKAFIDLLSDSDPNKREKLCRLVAGSDAIDYARDVAQSYSQSALSRLAGLPDSDAKSALATAAEFVVQRRH